MHIIYKVLHILMVAGVLHCTATSVFAQSDDATNTFTPYSFYALGDLARPGIAYNLGMGGLGTGVRTTRTLNFVNPAALTAHDSLAFMFDFGLENQNHYALNYMPSGEKQQSASNSMNIHHLAMSFPVYNRVILGLGLFPYSSAGYDMQRRGDDEALIAKAGHTTYRYVGEGGITQGVLSIGVPIGKRLSLGGQLHYYFGSIDRYNIVDFEAQGYSDLTATQQFKVGNFGFSLGAQYERPLENGLVLTLGAAYQFATKIGNRKIDFAYTTTGSLVDTVRWDVNTNGLMSLPATVSAGFSLQKTDRWMFGLDYVFQDWRDSGFDNHPNGKTFKITPSHLVRTGFEWTPERTDFRHYLKRCTYRIGLSYESTYMQFSGYNIKNAGATVGFGLPVNRWNNSVSLAAEVGRRGTTNNELIRETYVKFSLSFSIYDIWFIKPKIE
jgi:long-subunit fatty acid transport protein